MNKKKVKFDQNITTYIIPQEKYTIKYNRSTIYDTFVNKYKNSLISINLTIKIPYILLQSKYCNKLFFKISKNNSSDFTYVSTLDNVYSDENYDIYNIEKINIDINKSESLKLKIMYDKTPVINSDSESDDVSYINDMKIVRKILTLIILDYQEMLENYESGDKFLTFKDWFTGIVIGYSVIII